MPAMESLIKLFNELEIQLLVLLSFTLQLFLFFAGSLRRCSSNMFLRHCLWVAYLGADIAAVYALGYLSRHEQTQQLAFFWAPFLLIHLGGQDTITAFAMEDNNLWLRHLLNLVTQVSLALYVFWKSIGRHNAELLIPGIFVFVAGIIKYGERTWSLMCGSLESIERAVHNYRKELPEGIAGDVGLVCSALQSMPYVLDVLSERNMIDVVPELVNTIDDCDQMIRKVKLQLGMIYDDLYTKALVLRTLKGIIFRCISQASVVVAFAFFHANDKERYSKTDIAITYSLFVGCFFLEVCSMFISMMSPWTWAWLKVQKCNALARLSWFIFCRDIGYPKMKQRWPNLIGQYNFHSWLTDSDLQPRTYRQQIMILFRKLFVDLFGVGKKKIFWLSKILDPECMGVDSMIVEGVAKEISLLRSEFDNDKPQEWIHIGHLIEFAQRISFVTDFGYGIVAMHHATETYLRKYASSHSDMEANATREDVPSGLMEVCRKLSKYMMYLLVTHPSILPLSISATATLDEYQEPRLLEGISNFADEFVRLGPSKGTLEELARMWTRLLLYAAGKSRAAMHAAELSRGGELITFAWLLMAHCGIGDSRTRRIQLTNATNTELAKNFNLTTVYVFYVPPESQIPVADYRSDE